MKSKKFSILCSALAAVCVMLLATTLQAVDPTDRLEGRIHTISADKTTLTLHVTATPGATAINRYVMLTGRTQFTFQNQPGSFDQIEEGLRVICVGKFDANGKLIADRVDVRRRR
jgi:hypothetical protein